MRPISLLVTVAAAAAVALVPATALAAPPSTTALDVRSYDPESVVSAGSFGFAGLTTGTLPYDGPSTTEVRTDDGTLPQANTCEPGSATVTLTSSAGTEQLTVTAAGEVCTSFSGTAHQFFGGFRTKDLGRQAGQDRVRVAGEGLLSAAVGNILPLSGQLSVSATLVR